MVTEMGIFDYFFQIAQMLQVLWLCGDVVRAFLFWREEIYVRNTSKVYVCCLTLSMLFTYKCFCRLTLLSCCYTWSRGKKREKIFMSRASIGVVCLSCQCFIHVKRKMQWASTVLFSCVYTHSGFLHPIICHHMGSAGGKGVHPSVSRCRANHLFSPSGNAAFKKYGQWAERLFFQAGKWW